MAEIDQKTVWSYTIFMVCNDQPVLVLHSLFAFDNDDESHEDAQTKCHEIMGAFTKTETFERLMESDYFVNNFNCEQPDPEHAHFFEMAKTLEVTPKQ